MKTTAEREDSSDSDSETWRIEKEAKRKEKEARQNAEAAELDKEIAAVDTELAEERRIAAMNIDKMSMYDLMTKIERDAPQAVQEMADARRAVLAAEKAAWKSEQTAPAINDTTPTTGKHPELKVPASKHRKWPASLVFRKWPKGKQEKIKTARATGEEITRLQDDIRADILEKGELIREDEPDDLRIKALKRTIDQKQAALKKTQGLYSRQMLEFKADPAQSPTPSPPSSPTGAIVGAPHTPIRRKSKPLMESATPVGTPIRGKTSSRAFDKDGPVMDPVQIDFDTPPSTPTGSKDDEKRWSGSDSSNRFEVASDAGNVSDGSEREIIMSGDWADDDDAVEVREVQQNAAIQILPWYVPLPTNPLMKFKPAPAPINDEGNAAFFHRGFFDRGGPRNKVGIPFGHMLLRPKSVEIVVTRNTFATRQELARFLTGRFPMGGVINKKSYSSAALPLAVFRSIPGRVTVTY